MPYGNMIYIAANIELLSKVFYGIQFITTL